MLPRDHGHNALAPDGGAGTQLRWNLVGRQPALEDSLLRRFAKIGENQIHFYRDKLD